MTYEEARQTIRTQKGTAAQLLRAHSRILQAGMTGAGDSAKMTELVDAVSTICRTMADWEEGQGR